MFFDLHTRSLSETMFFSMEKVITLLNNIPVASIIADKTGLIKYSNKRADIFLGNGRSVVNYTVEQFLSSDVAKKRHQQLRHQFENNPEERTMGGNRILPITVNGHIFYVKIHLVPIKFTELPDSNHTIAFILDYTNETTTIQELNYRIERDKLTGAHNRDHMLDLFSGIKCNEQSMAIVSIGLENFSAVNDSYSFNIGDDFLKMFSKTLQENISDSDYLCRLYGDVFILIIKNDSERLASEKLKIILNILENPFHAECGEFNVVVNSRAGYAIMPDDFNRVVDGINYAELALLSAKNEFATSKRFEKKTSTK